MLSKWFSWARFSSVRIRQRIKTYLFFLYLQKENVPSVQGSPAPFILFFNYKMTKWLSPLYTLKSATGTSVSDTRGHIWEKFFFPNNCPEIWVCFPGGIKHFLHLFLFGSSVHRTFWNLHLRGTENCQELSLQEHSPDKYGSCLTGTRLQRQSKTSGERTLYP